MSKEKIIIDLAKKISVCPLCRLCRSRTHAVPGEGSARSQIFFIGEGPGVQEDKMSRPFCGAAGEFLDELLSLGQIKRKDVFITNLVKCRPPQNRDPLPDEIEACSIYLNKQLEIINPKLIVLLGRHAMSRFFPEKRISAVHGKAYKKNNQVYFISYHPAAGLYHESLQDEMKKDFAKIHKLLKIIG